MGAGLAVIDNININETLITRGNNTNGNKDQNKDKGDDNDQGEDD